MKIKKLTLQNKNSNTPRISIILTYELKMRNKEVLLGMLSARAERAEKQLLREFSEESVLPVICKLRNVIQTIQCPIHEKNIAIFISPYTEKVYYFTPSHLEKYKLPVLVQRP